ncbi:predicted protein [Histoplasma mississippiense (nom. inval.)]|uniref:predicted protein n=1 Tax=Ajellomyces capsulatus (strain NAm1 / WU24) TaxID=2059318 RepID=UPI000157D4B9|nr:predicted protein [Histoplasma mississippiense (nom. inval.)]EDN05092.1 predicted protein [Histoplasma mississippiense (nom. inval.)]
MNRRGTKRVLRGSDGQLQRLQPFVGDLTDTSYFMATFYMYFPFLTCEVKCGAAALDIADRQNAHSTTIAARATVELFKLMKRKKEIDREILTFSVSHDHTAIPPDVDFDVSQSELQYSQQSNSESVLAVEDDDSQPSQRHIASAGVTPTTSFTKQTQIFKRPRKKQSEALVKSKLD